MVFVLPSDGSGTPTQVTDGREDVRAPEWSPDGNHIVALQNWGTHAGIVMASRGADGRWSAPRPFPVVVGTDTLAGGLAVWSPDGRYLACACGEGGLVLLPAGGGPGRRLLSPFSTAGWAFPQWSADGRTLYHLTEDSGRVVAAVAVPVDGGAPRVVLRFDDPSRPWHRFGFRVRGDRFFVTLGDQESDIWVADIGGR
jgi:Tol biopolymer transport system component